MGARSAEPRRKMSSLCAASGLILAGGGAVVVVDVYCESIVLHVIPADRRPPEREETWTLAADRQDPCVLFDDTVDPKARGPQDLEKAQLKSAEAISADAADNADGNNLPRSQEIRKSKTKKVKNYLRKCKGALSKADETATEKKRQENCTSWYLEDVSTGTSHQEARDELPERYTEFRESRLDESIREPIEDLTIEAPQVSCSENLESTPDEALARLLEEDRRADVSSSKISLYEDARATSPELQPVLEEKTSREPERFHDEAAKNVAVSLETLTTRTADTNLDKCGSSDTLIAEVPEVAETAAELPITAPDEESVPEELVDATDEETALPVPVFCGSRGHFASVVRSLLGPIYGHGVMNLLIRQARDILVCAYHGNLENFIRIYLSPAAALLTEVKCAASET
ncbi:hypothetical protein HN011_002401, partial [Eciton burchellii]